MMQRAILFVTGVLFTVATVANAQACQAPVQLSTALSILSVVKDLSSKVSKLQSDVASLKTCCTSSTNSIKSLQTTVAKLSDGGYATMTFKNVKYWLVRRQSSTTNWHPTND